MVDINIVEDKRSLMVSIRCAVYNHEPYLRQCLDGFVMQKTNFRFEAIVHDDASTDGSAEIIREYAEKYPDIIKPIYETENQYSKKDGSLTRIMDKACTGKYIALCEGDDYWIDPDKLQKQVDFLEANPDYSMVTSNGEILTDRGVQDWNEGIPTQDISTERFIVNTGIFICTASMVYVRSIKDVFSSIFNRAPVGDRPLKILCSMNGKVRYFAEKQVVYRKSFQTQSWSARTLHASYEKDIKLYEGIAKMEKVLDAYSNHRYTTEFHMVEAQRLVRAVRKCPEHGRAIRDSFVERIPDYEKYLTLDERLKLGFILRFPKLSTFLKRNRHS